jgi:hypothetical protein
MLLRGCTKDAQNCLQRISEEYQDKATVFWGWLSFVRVENEKAIKY